MLEKETEDVLEKSIIKNTTEQHDTSGIYNLNSNLLIKSFWINKVVNISTYS